MAPGHHSAQATCEPERSTPSKSPPSILWARSASQFPSAAFGAPLKLQPQPGSQLQNSRYVPESFQSAMSDVALADYLPSSLSLRRAYSLRRGTSSHAPGRTEVGTVPRTSSRLAGSKRILSGGLSLKPDRLNEPAPDYAKRPDDRGGGHASDQRGEIEDVRRCARPTSVATSRRHLCVAVQNRYPPHSTRAEHAPSLGRPMPAT